MNTRISFTPTQKQLDEIRLWLIAEREKTGDGFYCNWPQIQSAFDENKMAVVLATAKPVGFVTWGDWSDVYRIEITEIKPSYRKKGYGKILIEELTRRLAQKGVSILRLHCQPSSSELIWKRMGFMEFPKANAFENINSNSSGKHLYKILEESQPCKTELVFGEKIELWDIEPYQVENEIDAKWIWEVLYKGNTRELISPIISPANKDWMIRWSRDGITVAEGKVKYFLDMGIDVDDFMIIRELMAPING